MTNMLPKQCTKQRGQGLIESLAIILFISVAVVALVKFQHYLSYSTDITQQQSYATVLANSQLETLRDYQVLTTTSGYSAYSSIANGTSTSTIGGTTYTLTWAVTANTSPTYKTISVAVTWTDRTGTTQTVTLVSDVDSVDPALASTYM